MKSPEPDKYAEQGSAGHVPIRRSTFDHEGLDVYQLELEFISWVTPLIDDAHAASSSKAREICAQLDRASLSCLLNTAEGNGKRRRQGRAKFFDDARGSATECAACLDALVAKKLLSADRIVLGKQLLLRVVSMLCRLVDRFDLSDDQLHEDSEQYRIDSGGVRSTKKIEDENENDQGILTD